MALLSQPRGRADQKTRVCQIRFATGDREKTGDGGRKVPHRAESSGDQSWPQALGSGRGGFRRALEGNGQGGPSAAVSTKTEGSPRANTICRPADRRGPTSRCGWRSPAAPRMARPVSAFFQRVSSASSKSEGWVLPRRGPQRRLATAAREAAHQFPSFPSCWRRLDSRLGGGVGASGGENGTGTDPYLLLLHLGGGGFGQDCAFHRLCGINEQFTGDVSAVSTTGLPRQDRAGPHLEPW